MESGNSKAAQPLALEETAGERERRFRQQPWYQEEKFESVEFLKETYFTFQWCFIIYRTVYTPESNNTWATGLEKLRSIVKFSIDFQRLHLVKSMGLPGVVDSTPDDLVYQEFQNEVIEDRERLDQKGAEALPRVNCAER
jgi:hypothetical protein